MRTLHTAAPRRAPRLVGPLFLLVMLATFAYFTSIGALVPTLPRFIDGPLGGTDVEVGLGIGAFSLAAVLLRPWVGTLSDERGRRVVIVAGGLLVATSTYAYVLADSLAPLLALRFLAGAGEASFYVGAASVINDLAPDQRRGEALSYFSLALFGGLAVGPVLGESVLAQAGYDATWVVAGTAAALATGVGAFVRDTRPHQDITPSDAKGRRRLLHPAGVVPGLVLASAIWGLAGFNTFVPLYALTLGLGGSRTVFALYSAIVLAMRSLGARIPDRFGPRSTVRFALLTAATGFAVMAAWPEPAGLYAGTAGFALGQSLVFPALMTMALNAAPAAERGAVVGTFTAFFDLAFGGGAISLGLVAHALGYRGVFASTAVLALLGLALLLRATSERGGRPGAAS